MNDINFNIPDSDDRGVSPVIGVILMVAITVILAAVIASFVLGFGGSVNENAQAGVNVDDNETDGVKDVTVTSLGDSTDAVWCSSSEGSNVTTNVGDTFQCSEGSNIVANTTGGSDTVIRTDI